MSGVFDLKKGAFDSSEAARLHEAYAIALQGLRSSQEVDRVVTQRLARSIVKVARTEADCLRNDNTIDPVRLAQRAILRMLQMSAPMAEAKEEAEPAPRERQRRPDAIPDSPAKIMMRLFDRTSFAKL